ncbi:MAG: PSD1 and planctomycete cytochrome C domain-containing protein [Acidobacteriota bacterium]|nr:PSD1 and planctomycete cytochrome C domain-containing protein [Acidobacteriota bacterium]
MTTRFWLKLFIVFVAVSGLFALRSSSAQSAKVDFARDIQPIFRAHCQSCHGEQTAKGQLRLDNKASAMKGGISGAVIVPGDARNSRLLHRVRGEGGEKRMPLGGESLRLEQIELLRLWIEEGANWPENESVIRNSQSAIPKHWAFTAPIRPITPKVSQTVWVKNPIDAFVLARLEKEKLTPSPEADRATLLRRLSLDLIGLPPTIAEVDAFLADKSPNVYEKQVDRLLNSPHYGERWGRLWLDAARYADSDGYEKDKSRSVWFYRDWVINALNADKPYDQFIIEQIAGDLLPNPTQDQFVATGFLRNSMINQEGGVDPEQFRMEAMFDRMDAVGKSVLGLTIQCAQCHNHKFDPIKQEDYYRMFAFLNNSHESNVAVYTPAEHKKRAEVFRRVRELETELQHHSPDWQQRLSAWEASIKNNQPTWTIFQPEVDEISTGGQRYLPQPDKSFLSDGYAPVQHKVKMTLKTDVQNITAFRLELMNDPNLPRNGPGRSITGSCAITEFEATAAPANDPKKITKLKFAKATADVSVPERDLEAIFDDQSGRRRTVGPVEFAIDGKNETAWTIDAGPALRNQPRKAVFTLEKPITMTGDILLTFNISQNHGGWNNNDNQQNQPGRMRLSYTTAPNAVADPLPAVVREILSTSQNERTEAQTSAVFSYWRTTVSDWRETNAEIARLLAEHPEGSTQLVLNERAELRESHLLKRGDFLRPDKTVTPGVPAFLHPLPENAKPDRLTFARWLVDRNSPTTARSIVNRIWQAYFGIGLLETSEDFGSQSPAPSHRELLDWLAVELMDARYGTGSGSDRVPAEARVAETNPVATAPGSAPAAWSLKRIHRLIVTSATYKQSSSINSRTQNLKSNIQHLASDDPQNRLLARGPRFRVDAELVRDIALSVSGLLNPKIGGASVYPPAPSFLFDRPFSYGPKVWKEEKGENRYRRALYTFRYRSVPYPMLQSFDAPTGDISCVRRTRSNSPLQALTTLNETLFVEAARALALKVVSEGGATDRQRAVYGFRRVLSRQPPETELSELLGLFNRQRERFLAGDLNAWNLATNDPDKAFALPKNVRMEELAAWTAVARVLLNLDETITKE